MVLTESTMKREGIWHDIRWLQQYGGMTAVRGRAFVCCVVWCGVVMECECLFIGRCMCMLFSFREDRHVEGCVGPSSLSLYGSRFLCFCCLLYVFHVLWAVNSCSCLLVPATIRTNFWINSCSTKWTGIYTSCSSSKNYFSLQKTTSRSQQTTRAINALSLIVI